MDRLTERVQRANGDVVVYIGPQRVHEDADVPAEVTPSGVREILHRLAAYEDTGLEPEEVTAIKHAFMGREIAKITEFDGIPIQRLQELARAEKDGRPVVQDIFALWPIECCDKCEKYVDDRIGCKGLEAAIDDNHPGAEWGFMVKTCPKEVMPVRATQERLRLARDGKTDKDGIRFFLSREAAEATLEEENNETD